MSALNCCKNSDVDVQLDSSYDAVDKPPSSYHVSYLYLASLAWSIVLHFGDLAFDAYVAYNYAAAGKTASFAWTLAFILLPAIIMNSISATMYMEDCRKIGNTRFAGIRIILCLLGIPFQSALLIRYFDSFWYAIKSLKAEKQSDEGQQQKYFRKMLNEDSDAALLRILECYLESAPQQILQITLLLKDLSRGLADHQTWQLISVSLGFISMAWGMANYHRCLRLDQDDKKNISTLGVVVQFFLHLNLTVSRILLITAMVLLNMFWIFVAVFSHWCAMTVWVALSSKSKFCGKNKIFEILFYGVIGLVYIFNFLNLNDGPTRQSYTIFYLLCFVENITGAILWGVNPASTVKIWVYYVFTILPVFCFLLSVIFLGVYYQFLHPSKIKICRNERI